MTRLLEMRGIVKTFGPVRANDGIDLSVDAGRIVGLLGENGSGKSTLMKVLFGMLRADSGSIVYKGQELSDHDPRAALARGIGMIHQHFMLVEAMTVAENIMLGWDEAGSWLRRDAIAANIRETSERFALDLDPDSPVENLSLGRRQRVEILKALMRGAELLVLDEPTSNLSPPEVSGLLAVMRELKVEGKGIIFISHKLHEVMEICDEVVVLRDGRVSGQRPIADATDRDLARMMIERDISEPMPRLPVAASGAALLDVRDLATRPRHGPGIQGVSFALHPGEIVAVAGVDGNGQIDLVEAIAGLVAPSAGRISLAGKDVTRLSVAARVAAGIAYIPPDRAMTSLIQGMSVAENLGLRDVRRTPFSTGPWLNRAGTEDAARDLIGRYAIRASGPNALTRELSGGNQQKIVVAREIARVPRVLIAFQATWGLDPGATRFVSEQVIALRNAGSAILYVSADLEEVLALGDRIGVMFNGRIVEIVPRFEVDLDRIGLLMAGRAPASHRDLEPIA